ncbi:SH3 domain-containing protein [Psychroserpens sp. NJDZ02]|uniref:SH3 domain-containing protein n=1 Tax=Psychroserpens sp. NJDZ02 TaxID=2570561 RepID=UPI0010A77F0D|nr:SH3 domain-containing protein [Psychroserpens sp. NJDZ02]QCE43051.1 SH3 domain-containing protein [Psychroserpens sp. NJDZ02]
MMKIFVFSLLTLLFISCDKVDDFSGIWFSEKNQVYMDIDLNNSKYSTLKFETHGRVFDWKLDHKINKESIDFYLNKKTTQNDFWYFYPEYDGPITNGILLSLTQIFPERKIKKQFDFSNLLVLSLKYDNNKLIVDWKLNKTASNGYSNFVINPFEYENTLDRLNPEEILSLDFIEADPLKKSKTEQLTKSEIQQKIEVKKKTSDTPKTFLYVTAENGLLIRESPEGEIVGKFIYGEKVEILEVTNTEKTIIDNDKEIKGKWVKVKFNNDDTYVFDGFLGEPYDLTNLPKKIIGFPVEFIESRGKAVLKPKNYKVFNEKLVKINNLNIEAKTEVEVLRQTKFKREEKTNQDYCDWSNYVEIVYNNHNYILFGENVLLITREENIKLQEKTIIITFVKNYIQESTDEDGLTFCDGHGDFTNIMIKENNVFFVIKDKNSNATFGVMNSDGVGESIGNFTVVNNTINAHIEQSFQEGTGSYDVKLFYDNGWKYKESNLLRKYQ